MPYINQADLETRYGAGEILQLSDRDGDGNHDTGIIDTAIADAESTVDNYLAERVTVPVDNPSNDLKKIVSDIARKYLYTNTTPDGVKNAFDRAMKRLRDFAAGKGGIDGIVETQGDLAVVKSNHTRVFTEESLNDY